MNNNAEEVLGIITSKGGLKYSGIEMDAMLSVANAYTSRSLRDFEKALEQYEPQLMETEGSASSNDNTDGNGDAIMKRHVQDLYDTLLEQNLLKIIEPFSRVEVTHVAKLIGNLDIETVERKLSQMILDKKLYGTLDQGEGCLIVFDAMEKDDVYEKAIETIKNMELVVDSLFARSAKIVVA